MKGLKLFMMFFLLLIFTTGCGPKVIPEMQECMNAHGSLEKYTEVIKKYAAPELLSDGSICCTLENNRIINTETVGDTIYYWEEGTLIETCYEIPSDVIQIIKVGWKDKKIVYLEFLGPVKYYEKRFIKSKKKKDAEKKIIP